MGEQRQVPDWVCVAVVASAHGIRGALKLRSFTERPEDVTAYGPLYDRSGNRLDLEVIGQTRGGVLARAPGVEDRTAAEALRGTELYVPRAALPELAPDEFYHADLEGLEVRQADGSRLGVVRALADYGAGDLIEVQADDGRVLTLPFDHATVPEIDLSAGHLVVEPPAGLLGDSNP